MLESVRPIVLSVSSDNSSTSYDNGSYDNGSNILIKVLFNEPVFVDNSTGNPRIELETGSTDDNATYIGGLSEIISGNTIISKGNYTNTLYFLYTVGPGDNSSDLDYKSASSLSDNGSTIRDNSSNDAILTLPDNGSSGSLGGNVDADGNEKYIVIDTAKPTALLITCSPSICVDVTPSSGYVTVRSTEIGTAYLVFHSVSVNNVLTNITNADDNLWNSVDISSTSDNATIYTTGLKTGTFMVYTVDAAGNVSDASVGPGGWSALRGSMKVKP